MNELSLVMTLRLSSLIFEATKFRLGIVAPTSISVHRKEVYEAIRKENEHAATLRGDVPMIHAPTHAPESLKRLASGPAPAIKQFRRESA